MKIEKCVCLKNQIQKKQQQQTNKKKQTNKNTDIKSIPELILFQATQNQHQREMATRFYFQLMAITLIVFVALSSAARRRPLCRISKTGDCVETKLRIRNVFGKRTVGACSFRIVGGKCQFTRKNRCRCRSGDL